MNTGSLVFSPEAATRKHSADEISVELLADGSADFLLPGLGVRYSGRELFAIGITACPDLMPVDNPRDTAIVLIRDALKSEVCIAGQLKPYAGFVC